MSAERDQKKSSNNLFAGLPSVLPEELIEVLVENQSVRIERIVSIGHKSPDGFWYDQDEHEWVVVLKGRARLRLEDTDHPIQLGVGDHIHLAPHRKHRVDWTTPDESTIWLAVFYR
jgi:cupin 2 domain-containing protein